MKNNIIILYCKKHIFKPHVIIPAIFILLVIILVLVTGGSRASKLKLYILTSSGGGRISSEELQSVLTLGQNVANNADSSNFQSKSGYIPNVVVSAKEIPADDLQNAHVFPNPYKPDSNGPFDAHFITFTGLTPQADIKIYDISGELVASIQHNSGNKEYQWDVLNDYGKKLASGVYIFYITNSNGQKKTGKFSIIR